MKTTTSAEREIIKIVVDEMEGQYEFLTFDSNAYLGDGAVANAIYYAIEELEVQENDEEYLLSDVMDAAINILEADFEILFQIFCIEMEDFDFPFSIENDVDAKSNYLQKWNDKKLEK